MAALNGLGPLARGDGQSCPMGCCCLWSSVGGWRPTTALAHRLRGRSLSACPLLSRWSLPMERLRGMIAPSWHGPNDWEDGESCPFGGRCLWSVNGGWLPPMAQAHWLGGRGVLPRRWSLPMDRQRGMAIPNGVGPQAGGIGCPAQAVVAAYGASTKLETLVKVFQTSFEYE